MQPISTHLLCLPTEILEMITIELEYASEVNSFSQTCQLLYSIANHRLFTYFAKECSPRGFDRIVKNNDAGALCKLLVNGASLDQYFRTTGHPTPIRLTVEKDLSKAAKILVVYIEVILKNDERKYGFLPGSPGHREFEDDLERTLYRAAVNGSLGLLKAISSSPAVNWFQRASALAYAVGRGQSESARYLIEEAGVDVNKRVILREFFDSFLAQAARRGDLEMVKLLVGAGADLKCPDFDNIAKSPLHIAAANNHDAIVQYLIGKGMCFFPVKFFDILELAEYSDLPNYTISRIVRGDDIRAIMASPTYNGCGGYARGCFYTVAAACGDQSLYRDIWELRDPSHDQQNLVGDFAIAVIHGQITFVRYLVGEMIKLESTFWQNAWASLISYTIRYDNVPAFDVLLDCGPPNDLPEVNKGWLDGVLSKAINYPGHIKVLLERGYLDKIKDIKILKGVFAGAFEIGDLAFVCRLLKIGEFGILDTLHGPDLEYHERSILQIAAHYSSVETFKEFLTTHNLTLDPKHPIHCAALVSAALGTNIDILEFFLKTRFEINALYETAPLKRDHAAETLIIQVATVRPGPDGYTAKRTRDDITATVEYLVDRGARIDAKDSKGRTALSIALETGQPELARMLFNRGADPLLDLESRDNLSGLEQLVQLFEQNEYDVSFLDMLQASLELMAVRGYRSHEFLHFMPRNEGTLARPRVISQLANAPAVKGPIDLPYYKDRIYVRWSHFFLIKALRKQYWRSRYPVSCE